MRGSTQFTDLVWDSCKYTTAKTTRGIGTRPGFAVPLRETIDKGQTRQTKNIHTCQVSRFTTEAHVLVPSLHRCEVRRLVDCHAAYENEMRAL